MFCASRPPSCLPLPELSCCSPFIPRAARNLPSTRTSDIFSAQPIFQKPPNATKKHILCLDSTEHRVFGLKERAGSELKDCILMPKKSKFRGLSSGKKRVYLIKAVAIFEPKLLVSGKNDELCNSILQLSSNSETQVSQYSYDEPHGIDDREKLRRKKISEANKGNVPWNKGRKHSPETRQRIRERTRIAMQNPKVKMKLVNQGHAQSEETRIRIGVGVREGWRRRRQRLMVQEGCLFEWRNLVAEGARNGGLGEAELQWDSYKILNKQLKQEWLQSVEKRKTMPRPKGSKRAPKSPEQRRKISEAISAKWADPGYRERVCSALAKYHGTPGGAEMRRRKPDGETSIRRETTGRKPVQANVVRIETNVTKNATLKRKKCNAPSYKDPMASAKLKMIRKIREQRATLETKKREATERAKLLIAEAEKASRALEMAAMKSPVAQASLLETKKLIAEAMRSIEGIESGQSARDTCDDIASDSFGFSTHIQHSAESQDHENVLDERPVNGRPPLFQLNRSECKDFNFDHFTLQSTMNCQEPSRLSEFCHLVLPSAQPECTAKYPATVDLHAIQPLVNGSVKNNSMPTRNVVSSGTKKTEASDPAAKTKMKWVCGKLVEVDED